MAKPIRKIMDVCALYGERFQIGPALTEYEMLMYEQLCNYVSEYCKVEVVRCRINKKRLIKELRKK